MSNFCGWPTNGVGAGGTLYAGSIIVGNLSPLSDVATDASRTLISGSAMSTLTDGQLYIGKTGAAAVAATITAGTNVTITNGPGSIKIDAAGSGSKFSAIELTSTSNQIVFSGSTITLSAAVAAAARVYSIVDAGANASFILSAGNQTLSGIQTISNTTDATTSSSGALVVAGGVGIVKNLYIGKNMNMPASTLVLDAGAITIAGIPVLHAYDGNGGSTNIFCGPEAGSAGQLSNVGTHITGMGYRAGLVLQDGPGCTLIGSSAGVALLNASNHTAIGAFSLFLQTGGTNNIAIGYEAGKDYTGTESNNILIGHVGATSENGIIRIGTTGTHTACNLAGVVGIGDTTNSTSTATGALVLAGGIGLAKDVTVGGLTASMPVKTNASKTLVSSAIDLTADVTGVLPIANGGTNSSTALANGTIMVSSGGKIVEGTSSSNPSFTQLTVTSGVMLPTTGGTPASFNFYEEVANTKYQFTGPRSAFADLRFVRMGAIVVMQSLYFVGASSVATFYSSGVGAVPARFRPFQDTNMLIPVEVNNAYQNTPGMITVTTAGTITVYSTPNTATGNFAGTNFEGWNAFTMTWTV